MPKSGFGRGSFGLIAKLRNFPRLPVLTQPLSQAAKLLPQSGR